MRHPFSGRFLWDLFYGHSPFFLVPTVLVIWIHWNHKGQTSMELNKKCTQKPSNQNVLSICSLQGHRTGWFCRWAMAEVLKPLPASLPWGKKPTLPQASLILCREFNDQSISAWVLQSSSDLYACRNNVHFSLLANVIHPSLTISLSFSYYFLTNKIISSLSIEQLPVWHCQVMRYFS